MATLSGLKSAQLLYCLYFGQTLGSSTYIACSAMPGSTADCTRLWELRKVGEKLAMACWNAALAIVRDLAGLGNSEWTKDERIDSEF